MRKISLYLVIEKVHYVGTIEIQSEFAKAMAHKMKTFPAENVLTW